MKSWRLIFGLYALVALTGCAGSMAAVTGFIPEQLSLFLFGSGLLSLGSVTRGRVRQAIHAR